MQLKVLFKLEAMEQTSHPNQPLEDLKEIRNIMERSSRFISLSGLSGIFVGIFALLGLWFFYSEFDQGFDMFGWSPFYNPVTDGEYNEPDFQYFRHFAFFDALIVLTLSIGTAVLLTFRRTIQKGTRIWNPASKSLVVNLMLPLVPGGIFCLILGHHYLIGLIPAATLIFYGIALFNAGKYTLNDIRYLGLMEIILGLFAAYYTHYCLVLWALGFGFLHIIYGIIMYYKYER